MSLALFENAYKKLPTKSVTLIPEIGTGKIIPSVSHKYSMKNSLDLKLWPIEINHPENLNSSICSKSNTEITLQLLGKVHRNIYFRSAWGCFNHWQKMILGVNYMHLQTGVNSTQNPPDLSNCPGCVQVDIFISSPTPRRSCHINMDGWWQSERT